MNSKALIFGLLCLGLGTAGYVEEAAAAAAAPEAHVVRNFVYRDFTTSDAQALPPRGDLNQLQNVINKNAATHTQALGATIAALGAVQGQLTDIQVRGFQPPAAQAPQPPQALWRRGLQWGHMGLSYWLAIVPTIPFAISMYQWVKPKSAAEKRKEAEAVVRKLEMRHAANATIIAGNVESLTKMAAQRDQLKARLAAKPDEGLAPILVTLTNQVKDDTDVVTKQIEDQNKLAAKLNKLLAARAS